MNVSAPNGNPAHEPYDASLDPNSPERIKAAGYRKVSKVCLILAIAFLFVMPIYFMFKMNAAGFLLFSLGILSLILCMVLLSKERKIRCTKRTTGTCVNTASYLRNSYLLFHPVVEFEVEGVTHTVELSVLCSHDAVGDIYTLYYDPLDPDTVRPERRGLFD